MRKIHSPREAKEAGSFCQSFFFASLVRCIGLSASSAYSGIMVLGSILDRSLYLVSCPMQAALVQNSNLLKRRSDEKTPTSLAC